MNIYICVVGTSNKLFRRGQYTGKKNENEKYIYIYIYIKLFSGKTSLYLIVSFCTPHSLDFNRSFWQGSFVPICCVIHFPQITILEILVCKIQPEIMNSNFSTRFNFITKWLCNKAETRKDFRFHYFWLYFVYQNFQNGYFWVSLFSILFEVICGKWITQHIDTKLPCQKLLLKRREWGVQNESIK